MKSKAAEERNKWYPWFAWHPVRVPRDEYEPGQWVWLERVERCLQTYDYIYRLPQ